MAHVGKQVDRGVGDEFDVVGAARQRALDVAGIVDVEEIQQALPMQVRGHPVFLRRVFNLRPRAGRFHSERHNNSGRSAKAGTKSDVASVETVHYRQLQALQSSTCSLTLRMPLWAERLGWQCEELRRSAGVRCTSAADGAFACE